MFSLSAAYEIIELWDEIYFGGKRIWGPYDTATDLQWDLCGIIVGTLFSCIMLRDQFSLTSNSVINWFPIRLSFAVATAATLIALIAGSGLAWLLARKALSRTKPRRCARHAAARPAANRSGLLPAGLARHSFANRRFSLSHVWYSTDVHRHGGDHRCDDSRASARDEEFACCV